ncbi:MAG: hypothetical protein IPM18_04005 [Phycisphaerales bacterium]|nr:hypothetical protein [Phycisphaerales bacterium]
MIRLGVRPTVRRTVCVPALLILGFAVIITGCRRPPETAAPLAFDVDTTTPVAAAQSTLRGLTAQLAASTQGNRAAAHATRDRLIATLMAREETYARYRARAGVGAVEMPLFLARLVDNWAAAIAYYAADVRYDEARTVPRANDSSKAEIAIPAHGPNDDALIGIWLQRDAQGAWRVTALQFLSRDAATTTPATQTAPATQPNPSGA